MAGSLPWKPPPPLPIPYLLGERTEAEPSPLGGKAPFWAVRSCPEERGWLCGAPSGQRQCRCPWASLVWSCPGCWCQRLQRVSKAAQPYSVWGEGAAAQIRLGWCFYSQMPVYLSVLALHILGFTCHGGEGRRGYKWVPCLSLTPIFHQHPLESRVQI